LTLLEPELLATAGSRDANTMLKQQKEKSISNSKEYSNCVDNITVHEAETVGSFEGIEEQRQRLVAATST
jgi:hypothetical protein